MPEEIKTTPTIENQPAGEQQQPTDYEALATRLLSEQDSSQSPQQQQPAANEQQFEGWKPEEIENWKRFHANRLGRRPEATAPASPQRSVFESVSESASYDLVMPDTVTANEAHDWEPALEGLGQAAQADRIPAASAQHLADVFPVIGSLIGNQLPAGEDWTSDSASRALRRYWGGSFETEIQKVWSLTGANPKLKEWLNDTGLGDNPGVIASLALYADTKLSRDQARAELAKVTASKEYKAGSKPAVARATLLSNLVNADPGAMRARRQSQDEAREVAERTAQQTEATVNRAALQAESRRLLGVIDDRKSTKAERDAASALFQQIMAAL